jgi:hypothetical protein
MKYCVIFQCTNANYFWIVKEDLSLKEAEKVANVKNKYDRIHGGCCNYYIQPQN